MTICYYVTLRIRTATFTNRLDPSHTTSYSDPHSIATRRVATYTQNTQMRIHRPQKVKKLKVQKCNKNRRRRGVRGLNTYVSRNSSETTICLLKFAKFFRGSIPGPPLSILCLLAVNWLSLWLSHRSIADKSAGLDTLRSVATSEAYTYKKKSQY